METYLLILMLLLVRFCLVHGPLLLHAKLGNPCTVNWRLALAWCLINSTLVTQKTPHLPKHLAWFQCTYLRPIGNSKSTWESEEVLQCLQFMIWKKSNHRLQIKQVGHVERILKNSFAPSYLIGWSKGKGRPAPSSKHHCAKSIAFNGTKAVSENKLMSSMSPMWIHLWALMFNVCNFNAALVQPSLFRTKFAGRLLLPFCLFSADCHQRSCFQIGHIVEFSWTWTQCVEWICGLIRIERFIGFLINVSSSLTSLRLLPPT